MKITNEQVLKITLYSLTLEMMYRTDRRQRLDIRLRIDDRDLRIVSDYKHTNYDILDLETGKIVAMQPANDFFQPIDTTWLEKDCETLYELYY